MRINNQMPPNFDEVVGNQQLLHDGVAAIMEGRLDEEPARKLLELAGGWTRDDWQTFNQFLRDEQEKIDTELRLLEAARALIKATPGAQCLDHVRRLTGSSVAEQLASVAGLPVHVGRAVTGLL